MERISEIASLRIKAHGKIASIIGMIDLMDGTMNILSGENFKRLLQKLKENISLCKDRYLTGVNHFDTIPFTFCIREIKQYAEYILEEIINVPVLVELYEELALLITTSELYVKLIKDSK